MGGKRRAPPSGFEKGKAAASVDAAVPGGAARMGPSDDTLQRALPLVLERLQPEGAVQLFQVCPISESRLRTMSRGSQV